MKHSLSFIKHGTRLSVAQFALVFQHSGRVAYDLKKIFLAASACTSSFKRGRIGWIRALSFQMGLLNKVCDSRCRTVFFVGDTYESSRCWQVAQPLRIDILKHSAYVFTILNG